MASISYDHYQELPSCHRGVYLNPLLVPRLPREPPPAGQLGVSARPPIRNPGKAHLLCRFSLDITPPSHNTHPLPHASPPFHYAPRLKRSSLLARTEQAAALTLLDTLEPEGILAVFDHGKHVPDGEPRHGGLVYFQQQFLRHQLAAALIGHLAGLHLPQVGELSILGAPLQFEAQLALRVPANDTLMDFASPVAFLFQAFGHGSGATAQLKREKPSCLHDWTDMKIKASLCG
ncbi:uncharacterized protein LOC132524348 [Lagenorhynchus albirostris]|uniref:uncharacterized protein LOC132524348 n=1 Tax=Lagenorhynchus albirostris TaxID=27610 RepID=UPI0028E46381|nr:uncharacterized protein LOC132524348 [Lagenorhynchus albirostris]